MHNTTLSPVYEFIDVVPTETFRKIYKKVHINNEWEDRMFIVMEDGTKGPIQQWLSEHYGPSKYGITWWNTFNHICMWDKIYTHWKLCE